MAMLVFTIQVVASRIAFGSFAREVVWWGTSTAES